MSKSWHDLKDIEDFAEQCKLYSKLYSETLSNDKKESLASHILGLTFADDYYQWEREYPSIENIEALASDLEWSNAFDVDEDWEKLIALIDDLYQQVVKK